jgi:hypothetical protein
MHKTDDTENFSRAVEHLGIELIEIRQGDDFTNQKSSVSRKSKSIRSVCGPINPPNGRNVKARLTVATKKAFQSIFRREKEEKPLQSVTISFDDFPAVPDHPIDPTDYAITA